ncbi:HD family phosphohydrolase [Salsuginibacillus kocurii]|uniref:HD family phosphohydrolase n=1 Tax=Salsuginibacillus kocurii TaxID=427078 RepID=UPI00047675AC|nr:HD family phosphohydrolase [Salsuginibacillus kocurii]
MTTKSSSNNQKQTRRWGSHRLVRVALFVLFGLILYAALVGHVKPEQLQITLSEEAPEDIRAPLTVENESATEQRREEALNNVEPVYVHQSHYARTQVERLSDIFGLIEQKREQEEEVEPASATDTVDELNEALSSQTRPVLDEEMVDVLLEVNERSFQMGREAAKNAVYEIMEQQIPVDEVQEARDNVENKIALTTVSSDLYDVVVELAQFAVIANYIYDDEATEEARSTAQEQVEPVLIREGELIVREGELVDHEIYEELSLTGLTEDSFPFFPYIGLALFVFLVLGMYSFYITQANTTLRSTNSHLLMFILIFTVTLMLMKLTSRFEGLEAASTHWVVPAALGSMLMTHLLSYRIALFSSIFLALCATIIFNGEAVGTFHFTVGVYVLFSCFAGIFFLGKTPRVMKVLKAGLFVSLVNIVSLLALEMIKGGQQSWIAYGPELGFAFLSGFLAAVLTLGLMPFFETGFGILSTNRLLELSNPNQPELRKILLEAPGTYHHSVMVANLAEAAAEAIGANGLVTRVGAYYHDIGKTKRPRFFIENQMGGRNPHDYISPTLSRTLIIAHPYDGADMLRKAKMPKEIIDIAEQHHGTTLVKYFYHKQHEKNGEASEEAFRYPGPKAKSKEAAIVGVADGVEAAVRSLKQPSAEEVQKLIKNIISARLEDGQFNECDLTMSELNIVATTIYETLLGTFHSRIEYPDEAKGEK